MSLIELMQQKLEKQLAEAGDEKSDEIKAKIASFFD